MVVHVLGPSPAEPATARPARAGFVVAGKVGNSVVRHRIARRLRPLVRVTLDDLAPGTDLVVRALPAAATAPSSVLADDLRAGLAKAQRPSARRGGAGGRQ